MSAKTVKCNFCGRFFKSRTEMLQHQRDRGETTTKAAPKTVTRPRRMVAPVSVPVASYTRTGGSAAREKGRDRYIHTEDVSNISAGTLVFDVIFSPHNVYRLKHLAIAYQRYMIHSLKFHIVPQLPTSSSGGYVAAFIRDPADIPSGGEAANVLTATEGSVTAKWWETTIVSVYRATDKFYTSEVPGQSRFSSPGSLCLAVDGKASQKGGITIYVEYDISFSDAGYEVQKDEGEVYAKTDIVMTAGQDYLATASGSTKAVDMLSVAQVGAIYRFPSPRSYLVNVAGDVDKLATYFFLKIDSATSVKCCSADGSEYGEASYHKTTMLFEKEPLVITKAPENFRQGSKFLCHQSNLGPLRGDSSIPNGYSQGRSIRTTNIPITFGDSYLESPTISEVSFDMGTQ